MNFCFRLVCLLTVSIMATHALSQDLSGWSDKTLCRQLLNNPDNTDYLEEGASRSLDCASGTNTSTKVDDKSNAFDGENILPLMQVRLTYHFSILRILWFKLPVA